MILRQWSQAAARPVSVAQLGRALEGVAAERIGACLDASGGTPVDRAAAVIEAVLTALPRAETVALIWQMQPCRAPWGRAICCRFWPWP